MMGNTPWGDSYFTIKQKVLTVGNKYYIYNSRENLVGFVKQKMFRLKEDIRMYSDESKQYEVLTIIQRGIVDTWGVFEVYDPVRNEMVGSFRRKAWRSIFKGEWHIADAHGNMIGMVKEEGGAGLILRKIFRFLPLKFHLEIQGREVGLITQKFKIIGSQWWLDLRGDQRWILDRRLAIAGAILMDAVEEMQRKGHS